MTNGIDRLKENTRVLLSLGIQPEIGPIQTPEVDETTEESVLTGNLPALIAIRGLKRLYSIPLFRGMNNTLNPLSAPEDRTLNDFEVMTDEFIEASGDRDPINLSTGRDKEFEITLSETDTEFARFDLEIKPGRNNDIRHQELLIQVQAAYMDLLSKLDLKRETVEEIEEGTVVEEYPPEEPLMTSAVELLSARIRWSKARKFSSFRTVETRQRLEDLQEINFILEVLGVEGGEEVSDSELLELWRNRRRNQIAMIDLHLYSVLRIQQVNGTRHYYDVFTPSLMIDYSKRQKPYELRRKMENRSIGIFKKLNIDEEEANAAFHEARGELDKAKLRFLAWLAEQPIMSDFSKAVYKEFGDNPEKKFIPEELNDRAMEHLKKELTILVESFNIESHGIGTSANGHEEGVLIYDRTVEREQDAYVRKLNFLASLYKIAKYLFTDEDMEKYFSE